MDDSGPVVIVELTAEAAASPNVATLIDACSVALRRGECTMPRRGATTRAADAVAVVTFRSSEPTEVLVELRAGRGTASTSRDIVFRHEDSESEKWRSVGFTIASLAGALGVQEAPRPTREPPPATPPVPNEKTAPRSVAPLRFSPFRIGARLELGPGLDRGPVRYGGALVAGYDLPGRVLGAWALAGHAFRSQAVGSVDMKWSRFGIGLSAGAALPFGVEARVALGIVLERIVASETDAASRVEESRSRWLSGVELDGSVRFPAATRVGGVLGGYVVRLSGGTSVVSHGVMLASSPATEGGLLAGMEVRL
jgi:hypothetical protein